MPIVIRTLVGLILGCFALGFFGTFLSWGWEILTFNRRRDYAKAERTRVKVGDWIGRFQVVGIEGRTLHLRVGEMDCYSTVDKLDRLQAM